MRKTSAKVWYLTFRKDLEKILWQFGIFLDELSCESSYNFYAYIMKNINTLVYAQPKKFIITTDQDKLSR